MGTIGGNLLQRNRCPYYRHPAFSCFKSGGDGCPARHGDHSHGVIFDLGPCVSPHPSSIGAALLTYEAGVEVAGRGRLSVADLFGDGTDGRHDHRLGPGDVLVAVYLPPPLEGERAAYRRVTSRALAEWPTVEAVCRLALTKRTASPWREWRWAGWRRSLPAGRRVWKTPWWGCPPPTGLPSNEPPAGTEEPIRSPRPATRCRSSKRSSPTWSNRLPQGTPTRRRGGRKGAYRRSRDACRLARVAIDIAGFVADLKEHAIDHGFHVHDERHIIETYSLRQSWEVDLHPESGCGRPLDLHLALDVDPRVLLALQDKLEEMADEWEEPPDEYHLDLFFNWAVPPLSEPPDLLVLATDLAGIGGVALSVEVSAIDSYAAVTDAPERRLTLVGRTTVSLVDMLMGREQLCEALDRSREVSEYLLERVDDWLGHDV